MDGEGRCPICLRRIASEAFLDGCFHRFCYYCILTWAEVVYSRKKICECPLCRTSFGFIIYNFQGTTFQRHSLVGGTSTPTRAFTSAAHSRRLAAYEKDVDNEAITTTSGSSGDNGKWLRSWIRRELQALMQDDDVDVVVHHVVGTLESMRKRKFAGRKHPPSFTQLARNKQLDLDALAAAVRPFVFDRAERFCWELSRFLASGLTIAAYDEALEEKAGEEVAVDLEVLAREALFDAEDGEPWCDSFAQDWPSSSQSE